jgi:hypothetical protein
MLPLRNSNSKTTFTNSNAGRLPKSLDFHEAAVLNSNGLQTDSQMTPAIHPLHHFGFEPLNGALILAI